MTGFQKEGLVGHNHLILPDGVSWDNVLSLASSNCPGVDADAGGCKLEVCECRDIVTNIYGSRVEAAALRYRANVEREKLVGPPIDEGESYTRVYLREVLDSLRAVGGPEVCRVWNECLDAVAIQLFNERP